MAIRYLIGAALMAGACVAHADVIPAAGGNASVQALYEKVSASVGSDMKVSLRQGSDGVYVTGLSIAKAAALAGDGMSVIATPDGFKIVDNSRTAGAGNSNAGGGAESGIPAPSIGLPTETGTNTGTDKLTGNGNTPTQGGIGGNTDISIGIGNGNGNGSGNLADATDLPEPSSVALMLAGLLGVAGLGRRRAR